MKIPISGRFLTAVGTVAVAGMLSALPAGAQSPVHGGTLTVGFPADANTFDPRFSVIFSERQVMYPVYNTLTRLGPDFSINPELATSWEVLDGGKRIVFKLREGVKFHDGTEFDANAVKWNIDSRLDEATKSPQRKQLVNVVESVEVIDKYTVEFNLLGPFPALMGMLAQRVGFVVSPAAARKHGGGVRVQSGGDRPLPVQGMGARQPRTPRAQPRLLGGGPCPTSTRSTTRTSRGRWSGSSGWSPGRSTTSGNSRRTTSARSRTTPTSSSTRSRSGAGTRCSGAGTARRSTTPISAARWLTPSTASTSSTS